MKARRWWRRTLALLVPALLVVGLLAVSSWAVVYGVPALYEPTQSETGGNTRVQAIATTRAGLMAGTGGLLALLSAGVGLWLTRRTHEETLRLQTEGQVTDRYTKAIEQIGEPDPEKVAVRLGGIYALERIAVDSARDHSTVVEVLSAFVLERTHTPAMPKAKGMPVGRPAADVQAVLRVLGRLPSREGIPRAHLPGAHLELVDLQGAHLEGANLVGVHLEGAILRHAHLEGADLANSHLLWAHLNAAHLNETVLSGARMGRADLYAANMESTRLYRAQLAGALNVTQGQLDSARGDHDTTIPDGLNRPDSWVSGWVKADHVPSASPADGCP